MGQSRVEWTRVSNNNSLCVDVGSLSSPSCDCDDSDDGHDDSPGSLEDFIDDDTIPDSQEALTELASVPQTPPPCAQPSEDEDAVLKRVTRESKLKRSWETRRRQSVNCDSSPLSSLVSTDIPLDRAAEAVDRSSCTLHAVVRTLPSLGRDVAFLQEEMCRLGASVDSLLALLKKSGTDCACEPRERAKGGLDKTVLGSPLYHGDENPSFDGHVMDESDLDESQCVLLHPPKRASRRLWRTLVDSENEEQLSRDS